MTCIKVFDSSKQSCESVSVHVAVEPTPPERDMISEGNPNTVENVVKVTERVCAKPTPDSLLRRRLWLEMARRLAAIADQYKTGEVPARTACARVEPDRRSGVQWGRYRGLPDATWEEALGLAFLRRSAEAAPMASPLHTQGAHGSIDRWERRSGDSPAELPMSSRDAEGRSP